MKSLDITWNGRMRVNEDSITPEQYKHFFGIYEFGIPFKTANEIFSDKDGDAVVPCDELNPAAIELIEQQLANDPSTLEGEIEIEGQTLKWSWDLLCLDVSEWDYDTEKGTYSNGPRPVQMSFAELPEYARAKILGDMLDDGYHSGMFDALAGEEDE